MNLSEGWFIIRVIIKDYKISFESTFPYSLFVEYNVVVETKSRSWSVNRRYKQFENLHYMNKNKDTNIPPFPEKRLFKTSLNIIIERKTMLTDYLNFFLHKTNFTSNAKLLEFLEIEKEFIFIFVLKYPSKIHSKSENYLTIKEEEIMVKKAKSEEKQNDFIKLFKKTRVCSNIQEKDKNEENLNFKPIDDFINRLESLREDMCQTVDKFWSDLKKQVIFPTFSKNEIYKLFFGTKSPEIKNGLIYHCGRVRQNILGAQACLNLLANLLDYEKNPECENYLVIFKLFHFGNIDQINLENHLKSNKPIVIANALKILKIVVTGDRFIDINLILKDTFNIDRYNNYILTTY